MVTTSFVDHGRQEVPFLIPPKCQFWGVSGDFGGNAIQCNAMITMMIMIVILMILSLNDDENDKSGH